MTDLLRLAVFAYSVAVALCQPGTLAEPNLSEFGFLADDPDSNYPSAAWTVIRNEYICYGDPHCYLSVFANATGFGYDEICFSVKGDSDAWYNIWDHIVFGVEVDCHFNKPGLHALYIDKVNIIANYQDVYVSLVGNTLVHSVGPVKPGAAGSVTIYVLGLKEIVIKIDDNVYICLRAKANKIFVYIRILRKVPKGDLQGILGAVENQAKAVTNGGTTLELEDNSTFPLGAEERHNWYCRRPLPRTCYLFRQLSDLIPDLNVYKLP